MANQWLRLWHEMPNDPKWRTIARNSGQLIGNVMSVYLHLLVSASNATERGRTQNICADDLASALEISASEVESILAAMQGKVLDGDKILGWEKRQVLKEDGSAERGKLFRENKKMEERIAELEQLLNERTIPNDSERKRPLDKDKDTDNKDTPSAPRFNALHELKKRGVQDQTASDWLDLRKKKRCPLTATALNQIIEEADTAGMSLERALAISCRQGWAGFKASWLDGEKAKEPAQLPKREVVL